MVVLVHRVIKTGPAIEPVINAQFGISNQMKVIYQSKPSKIKERMEKEVKLEGKKKK